MLSKPGITMLGQTLSQRVIVFAERVGKVLKRFTGVLLNDCFGTGDVLPNTLKPGLFTLPGLFFQQVQMVHGVIGEGHSLFLHLLYLFPAKLIALLANHFRVNKNGVREVMLAQ